MNTYRKPRTRWPRGTWMKLLSSATLRALLAQKGLSYAELADSARVSKGFISHLTAGRRTTCTPQVAQRIADRLDVPLTVLFEPRSSNATSQQNNQKGIAA